MSPTVMVVAKLLITLGVCLGFGAHQLRDLRRLKAKAAAEKAAGEGKATGDVARDGALSGS